MAKITKSQLKGIVKECLVEILSEGISASGASSLTENKKRKKADLLMRAEEKRLAEHRKKFETTVTDAVANATDDPIMREILSDTAKTTLQEQISNEGAASASGNNLQGLANPGPSAAGINLDSIFGAPSQKWADIAFTDSKT